MGYSVTFTPPEEALEILNYKTKEFIFLEDVLIIEIKKLCLHPKSSDETYRFFKAWLEHIKKAEEINLCERLLKEYEEEKMFYLCGWELIKEAIDYEETLATTLNTLMNLAILVDSPNYFTESDNYNTFMEDIDDILSYFKDNCFILAKQEIYRLFKKYQEPTETVQET